MIILDNLTVSYGKNTIYKDFSFEFGEGLNVVLGKSGTGKTTLLNVIANLVPFDGKCKSDKVAFVFQSPRLSPISVAKNVEMVATGDNIQQTVNEVLQIAHIEHLRDKSATVLSGGEQQRVALARAFASNRSVLLLDEPFQSLDYGIKRSLHQTLNNLLKNYNKTAVLVTHDIDEVVALADRVYLLEGRPCTLRQVAQIDTSRAERDEYSAESLNLRKQLQQLLI